MEKSMSEDFGMEKDKAYDKLKANQEASGKAKKVLASAGYARGGGVSPKHKDEKQDKKLIKEMVGKAKIKVKHGGHVEGKKAKERADKYKRGGSVPRGHTKININMAASQADKAEAMKKGVALGAQMAASKMGGGGPRPMGGAPMQARGPAPGAAMPPPGAAMPPPGGMPPSGPQGLPPMGQKRGGRTYAKGGKVGPVRVKGVPHLDGSAAGGLGRLQKIKSYGTKPKK